MWIFKQNCVLYFLKISFLSFYMFGSNESQSDWFDLDFKYFLKILKASKPINLLVQILFSSKFDPRHEYSS